MKAVVLAGRLGVEKCPLALVRPRALAPLVSDVVLGTLLKELHRIDVDEAIICANGKTRVLREHFLRYPAVDLQLGYHDDELPSGTAGCLRDVAHVLRDDSFLVVEACLFLDGRLGELVDQHRRSSSAMTVGCVAASNWIRSDGDFGVDEPLSPLGVYVAEPEVLDHVPGFGYFDIKEQLIPKLREADLNVTAVPYRGRHRRIMDARTYAGLVHELLSGAFGREHFGPFREVAQDVWAAEGVHIEPSATVIGSVVLGANALVAEGAVVAGPTLAGEAVTIGERAFVSSSILWPHASVGAGAFVEHAIVTDSFHVGPSRRLSHCVAVDRDLRLADVHGLGLAGYGIGKAGRTRPQARSIIPRLRKLWRSVMEMRAGGRPPAEDGHTTGAEDQAAQS